MLPFKTMVLYFSEIQKLILFLFMMIISAQINFK